MISTGRWTSQIAKSAFLPGSIEPRESLKPNARAAWQVNEKTENIGARRLYTVMERLLEQVSFEASDHTGQQVVVDAAYVDNHLDALVQDEDLSRFIL